jgi:hypothetical protein
MASPERQQDHIRRIETMRKYLLGLIVVALPVLGVAVLLAATAAPDDVVIDDCMKKKAAVEFPHKAHLDLAKCVDCHHTQEDLTADSGIEVEKCADCHVTPEKEETPICSQMSPSKNPYHITCVKCHKKELKENPESKAPTKCDQCHPKAS